MPNRLVLIIACLAAFPSLAQETTQKPSWLPKTFPDTFDLGSLGVAKLSADKETVQFSLPQLQGRMVEKVVEKTVMAIETRTRSVRVNGKSEDVLYNVQVPQTVTETRSHLLRIPVGIEKFEVALDRIHAWDLAGAEITEADLAVKLKSPAYLLAKEGDPKDFEAIDPFYRNVLRTGIIMIYIPVGSAGPPPVPVTSAVPPAPTVDPSETK